MQLKVIIVILAVACVGLGIALFANKKQADDLHTADVTSINDFSNREVEASRRLDELGQVNLTLSNDLASSQHALTLDAEQMTQLSNSLTAAQAALDNTSNELVSAEEQITNLDNRISDLETQNRALDDQADSLSNRLAVLTAQIEETKNELAVSETNASFLQKELQKQLVEKAQLEHKFNDIDELRAQVKRIKDEMFVARRIELQRYDNGNKKGGELLMEHNLRPINNSTTTTRPAAPNYDLNVEIGSDGSVKIIPPMGATNAPAAATNAPAH
jgi:hypothetical protein